MATDDLSAEEIHKLKQFSHALPDEQDKLDQLKNVDIDAIVDATGVSRRNVLQVILGLAAGGVVGGLSAQEIVQAVEADASTTDGDGNVGLPGDRVDVYADGIDSNSLSTGQQTLTDDVIEVYGKSGQYFDHYDISSYLDILDAMQTAIDDLPAAGGSIQFSGSHTAGTQLVVDKPVSINSTHQHAAGRGPPQGDEIVWTGGTTTPIVIRQTADSPDSSFLQGVSLGQFILRPETGGNGDIAVLVDGTSEVFTGGDNNGSIVRECQVGLWAKAWGGTNPTIWLKGTVFDIDMEKPGVEANDADGIVAENDPDATLGPPSGIYVYGIRGYTKSGTWAARLETNTGALFGGKIQQQESGAHGVAIGSAAGGGIYGTKFEGKGISTFSGGEGIQIIGPARGVKVFPSKVSRYATGVALGDGSGTDTEGVRIDTRFDNQGSQDILVRSGAFRRGLKIECQTPGGVTDNRNVDRFGEATFNTGLKGSRAFVMGNASSRPGSPRANQLWATRFDATTQSENRDILEHYDDSAGNWQPLHPLTGSYSGDGTTSQAIELNRRPRQVIIDDGTNTAMGFRGSSTIPVRGTLGGSISFDPTGFTVSDGGSDAAPNTNGTTYNFIAQ